MATRATGLLPCKVFFASGRIGAGILALLMQLTLVLWPFAVRWASEVNGQEGVDRMLAEISETYQVPSANIYARHKKRFGNTAQARATV